MKLLYKYLFLVLIVAMFCWPEQEAIAQGPPGPDTLLVEWSDDDINPVENRLRNIIAGDTATDGSRNPNRVYKLEKGGFYWNNDRITNNGFHLRIVGEPGDPGDPVFGNPPTLQLVNNAENQVDDKLIAGNGSLTLKNVYVIGCTEFGVQDAYQPI